MLLKDMQKVSAMVVKTGQFVELVVRNHFVCGRGIHTFYPKNKLVPFTMFSELKLYDGQNRFGEAMIVMVYFGNDVLIER